MNIETSELNPATASVLRRFSSRRRSLIWIRALAVATLSLVATMTILMLIDYRWLLPTVVRLLLSLVGYIVTASAMWWVSLRFLKNNDQQAIAKQLESVDPRLREDLLSAVELSSTDGANGSYEFRQRLQRVVALRAAGMDVAKLLPLNMVRSWTTATAAVACLGVILLCVPPLQFGRRIARVMLPGLAIERASITRVDIIRPDPASGFVAHGDAVGINAEITNLTRLRWGQWMPDQGVWLQYRNGDSPATEIAMTPRTSDFQGSNASSKRGVFAANLMMGESPVRYRIIAGDAVTLWNTLTPQSRPRVNAFTKEYDFPVYAKLPMQTAHEDHGDLRAIAGTRATITVNFDEPVIDAVIRLGNRRREIHLTAVDGSATQFKVTVPIETTSRYQVDAVSQSSGLSNPFGRHHSIVPIVDSPPIVRWDESLPATQVVSPIEVVSLFAEIVDDLPIERLLQKTVVNGKQLGAVLIDLEPNAQRHTVALQWDLIGLGKTLSVGDIVQTRLVAIDRRGQMTDSESLEFLIAEEGFDSHRHDSLDRLHQLTASIHDWFKLAKPATDAFDTDSDAWEGLHAKTDTVLAKIQTELSITTNAATVAQARIDIASPVEQIGKAIIDWRSQTTILRQTAIHRIVGENEPSNDTGTDTRQLSRQLESIDEQARSLFSHALTVAVMGDAISIRQSVMPLLDTASPIPATHYPRHFNALAGRLDAIETLIGSHASRLQVSSLSHIEKWSDWSDRWSTELRNLSKEQIKTETETKQTLARLALFLIELKQQTRHSILDGRLVSSLSQNARELNRTTQSVNDAIVEIANQFPAVIDSPQLHDQAVAALQRKVSSEGSLHRKIPQVDLRYAADLNLVKRAIRTVNDDEFVAAGGESSKQVYEQIASAIGFLTAVHHVESGHRLVARLASTEERLSDNAFARIDHPAQLEHFSIKMEHTAELLKKHGVESSLLQQIDQTCTGADFSEARTRTTRRRWSEDPMQSAAMSLGQMRDQLKRSLTSLKPNADDARLVLLKYAPTIAQLAETAAKSAEEAAETAAEETAAETTAEVPAEAENKAATTKSDDVVEALHDFANTADLMESDQREMARDADSAAAQIQAATSLVQESDADDAAAALEQLAEVLRATAEHFNNVQNNEDLTKSRQELRRREKEMNLGQDLDQLTQRTASIAEAAAKTPRQLLQQLEKQLQRNKGMQDELSDLSKRDQSAVQRDLARLVEDEKDINQSLESSDPDMQERKRRVSKELAGISRKLQNLKESLVAGAQRSSDWGNLDTTRQDFSKAQSSLDHAKELLESLKGEKDSLATIRDTAKRAADAVAGLVENIDAVAEKSAKESSKDLHRNEEARRQQQQSLQRFEREARKTQISGQQTAESQWKGEQNSAKQRINRNARLRSEALRQAKRLRQTVEKTDAATETNSRLQELQNQIDVLEDKATKAERAVKAAEDTQRFAKQRIQQESDVRKQLERQSLQPLDQPNPAAQLAQRFALAASKELQGMEKILSEAAAEMNASDDLVADPVHAKTLGDRQSRVSDDVQRAADDLQRIARHQTRLGQTPQAEKLTDIANEIEQGAKIATENAESDLRDASESPQRSPQANRQVAAAAEEIYGVGQRLSTNESLEDENSKTDRETKPSRNDRQLAKTLDELDRSIAKSQSGDRDQSNPNPSPSSAGEASPTLSSALQSIAQQVARRRQKSTQPGGSGNQPGKLGQTEALTDPPSGNGPPASGQGMPGAPPGGPSVPIDGIDRRGSQWGQLRSRSDENTGQPERGRVPNQYRREIEAYFRGIAREKGGKR